VKPDGNLQDNLEAENVSWSTYLRNRMRADKCTEAKHFHAKAVRDRDDGGGQGAVTYRRVRG
jgi:hypothetical protein